MSSSTNANENPRTSRVRQVILDAAVELLLHRGASEVTAHRIAEETGVARTTIYRQWPDQGSLVLATIDALVSPGRPQEPTSGDLQADLTLTLSQLAYRLVNKSVLPVFGALLERTALDNEFVAAQQRFLLALTWPTSNVLEEAKTRGELPKHLDCAVAATMLTAPLLQTHLLAREPIADNLIEMVVAQFMKAHVSPS